MIAVYDGANGTGNILWSWHIWRLKNRPADIVCLKFDKNGNSVPFTMMEYSLGAYNNKLKDAGSMGLLYQWGRKDPFTNANALTANNTTAAATVGDLLYKTAGRSASTTMEYAVKNPTTFITNSTSPYDWIYVKNDNLWGNPWGSNMTVAGQTVNDSEGSKSIYDPCPRGYRVPPQDTWTRAKNWANNANMGAWDATNLGFTFTEMTVDRSALWFPGAGLRSVDAGAFVYVGSRGHCQGLPVREPVLAAAGSVASPVRARSSRCADVQACGRSFRPVCLRTYERRRFPP